MSFRKSWCMQGCKDQVQCLKISYLRQIRDHAYHSHREYSQSDGRCGQQWRHQRKPKLVLGMHRSRLAVSRRRERNFPRNGMCFCLRDCICQRPHLRSGLQHCFRKDLKLQVCRWTCWRAGFHPSLFAPCISLGTCSSTTLIVWTRSWRQSTTAAHNSLSCSDWCRISTYHRTYRSSMRFQSQQLWWSLVGQ